MRDMHISHQPVVVPQAGNTASLSRTPVKRTVLPNSVAVSNNQAGLFTRIFFILWILTNRSKLKNMVALANNGRTLDHTMRTYNRIRSNLNVVFDDRIRAHSDAFVQRCPRRHHSRFMNQGHSDSPLSLRVSLWRARTVFSRSRNLPAITSILLRRAAILRHLPASSTVITDE